MKVEYEKWYAKEPPKTYSMNFKAAASGYLFGHMTTITTSPRAATFDDAKRMFDIMLADAGMVNLSSYNIVKE